MTTKQLKAVCAISLTGLLALSCGGSEDGPLLTGVFVDSPVSGLNYVTPTETGVTNALGQFNYREGEAVVFSIGNLALPVAIASDVVTPLDVFGSEDVNDTRVVNLARLLQSLDDDLNPSNGIVIEPQVKHAFSDAEVFDAEDATAVDDAVQHAFGGEREAVSAVAAQAHFVDTLSESANSIAALDQWQYLVPVDEHYTGDTLFVDSNGFSLTLDNITQTGTTDVNEGVYQLSGAEEDWFVSVADVHESRYACIAKAPTAVADCDEGVYWVLEEEDQALLFSGPSGNGLETGAATEATDTESSENTSEPASEETSGTSENELAVCDHRIEDPDGDGYGWQKDQSCVIPEPDENTSETAQSAGSTESLLELPDVTDQETAQSGGDSVPEPETLPEETAVEVDETVLQQPQPQPVVSEPVAVTPEPQPTEPVQSQPLPQVEIEPTTEEPEIVTSLPVETLPVTPPVTQEPTSSELTEQPVSTGSVSEVATSEQALPEPVAVALAPTDITDLIVLTGQTNAAAYDTAYDATLDAPDKQVMAYVEGSGWQPADLHQYWDGSLPGNYAEAGDGRSPVNNLGFQMAKALAANSDRVVGIILVAAPGEGISHWDYDSDFYKKIRSKVSEALSALPQKDTIDAMIWAQGETDWLLQGTADAGATGFSSEDSEFYRDYYPNKLSQLISNLRSEAWFAGQAKFLCTETKKAELNPHLMYLNTDDSALTACASASDLATRPEDPYQNQFSAASLRILGDRLANLYLGINQ